MSVEDELSSAGRISITAGPELFFLKEGPELFFKEGPELFQGSNS